MKRRQVLPQHPLLPIKSLHEKGLSWMTVVQRTVEAFPRGRTTEELVTLLGASFDESKRQAILAELHALNRSGVISLQRNGRWIPATVLGPLDRKATGAARPDKTTDDESLFAVPATISAESVDFH